MLVKNFVAMRKKKKEDDEIRLFGGLFLSSSVLKGTFASIFVNCQAVSFSLHAWFGVCSFFGHYLGDA